MEVTEKKETKSKDLSPQEEARAKMEKELFDRLISQYERPEEAAVAGGLVERLTRRVYERILGAEMNHYLGYEKGQAPKLEAGQGRQNHRNGASKKTLISEEGKLEIEVPRDEGSVKNKAVYPALGI